MEINLSRTTIFWRRHNMIEDYETKEKPRAQRYLMLIETYGTLNFAK